MTDASCIFCRIAAGEIPALIVHEGDGVLAFLDVAPLAAGHLLVIPKSHFVTLDEMSPGDVAAVVKVIPRLVGAIKKLNGVTGVNVLQNNGRSAGQVVEHAHFHLIPRKQGDGLGYRWNAGEYGEGEADRHFALIQAALADGA